MLARAPHKVSSYLNLFSSPCPLPLFSPTTTNFWVSCLHSFFDAAHPPSHLSCFIKMASFNNTTTSPAAPSSLLLAASTPSPGITMIAHPRSSSWAHHSQDKGQFSSTSSPHSDFPFFASSIIFAILISCPPAQILRPLRRFKPTFVIWLWTETDNVADDSSPNASDCGDRGAITEPTCWPLHQPRFPLNWHYLTTYSTT